MTSVNGTSRGIGDARANIIDEGHGQPIMGGLRVVGGIDRRKFQTKTRVVCFYAPTLLSISSECKEAVDGMFLREGESLRRRARR